MKNISKLLIIFLLLIIYNSSSKSVFSAIGTCNTKQPCTLTCPNSCYQQFVIVPNKECICYPSNKQPELSIGEKDNIYNIKSPVQFTSLGEILSDLLPYVFIIAGLILFFLIVFNGLKFLTSAGNPKNIEAAKQSTVAALIGFILILASYWLTQMAEYIFHIKILGP